LSGCTSKIIVSTPYFNSQNPSPFNVRISEYAKVPYNSCDLKANFRSSSVTFGFEILKPEAANGIVIGIVRWSEHWSNAGGVKP